ncbi:MAG: hypothetical protein M1814_004896 [Vezdaea aestivalis]|nr:MAG: hypothetical protein M1814_004896 [Vezdaea aestivalis]
MAATETLSRRRELEEEEGPLAKKIKISDLPVSASKRVAMDALVQTFKKKGAFDDLRKKVWAEFESSEAKQQFLSALPPILDRKIDADQSILSSDRGKATMLVEGEVDRSSVYKAVEESLSALIESHAPSAITEIRTFRAAEIGAEAAAEESQLGQKTEDEYRSETLQRLDIRQKAREVEFAKKRELEREEARKRRAEADRVKREEEELKQKQQEEQKKADRERREREDDVYARNRKRIRDADHDPAQDRDRDRRSYRDSEPRKDRHYRDMDRNRSRDRDRKVSPIARSQPRRSFSSSTKPSIIAATLTPEVNKSLEDEALTMLLKESQQRPGANTTSRHSAQAHDFDSRRPAKSLLSDTKGSRRESIQLRTTLDQASRVSDKTPRTPSGRDKQSRDVSRSPAASGAKKDRYKDQDRDRERDQKRDRDRDREKDRDRDREGYRPPGTAAHAHDLYPVLAIAIARHHAPTHFAAKHTTVPDPRYPDDAGLEVQLLRHPSEDTEAEIGVQLT